MFQKLINLINISLKIKGSKNISEQVNMISEKGLIYLSKKAIDLALTRRHDVVVVSNDKTRLVLSVLVASAISTVKIPIVSHDSS